MNLQTVDWQPFISVDKLLNNGDEILVENTPLDLPNGRGVCNRFYLATAQGRFALSIPLVGGRRKTSHEEPVYINYAENWCRDHMRTLESAYRKAPYFEWFWDQVKLPYTEKPDELTSFNALSNRLIVDMIGRDAKLSIKVVNKVLAQELDEKSVLKGNSGVLPYPQVFTDRHGFLTGLSSLDLFFNVGPRWVDYLSSSQR